MTKKIVITADLGTFKSFRVIDDPQASSPSLKELDTFQTADIDDRVGRRESGQVGQFGKGSAGFAANNDGANGERNNVPLEDRRRSIAVISRRMEELLSDDMVETCYFAAANEINGSILDLIGNKAKQKIQVNLTSNLVNMKKDQLLDRFLK